MRGSINPRASERAEAQRHSHRAGVGNVLSRLGEKLSASLWVVPTLCALLGVAAGILLPWLDSEEAALRALRSPAVERLVTSSPDGARQLLGSAGGALATILGVVFSLTVVTLQLASQQYTPRVLHRFMQDRTTKAVLGTYIGTVTYLLVLLRAVRAETDDTPGFVPYFSVLLGLLLTIACLVLLAVHVHHLSRSIQAEPLCTMLAKEAIEDLEKLPLEPDRGASAPDGAAHTVGAERTGYLQLVDGDAICAALPRGAVARVEVRTGDFLLTGTPLLSIWSDGSEPPDEQAIARAFAIGAERASRQDVLFSVRQIVDTALKALSPSTHDPTTAVIGVNAIGTVLERFVAARCGPEDGYRTLRSEGREVLVPVLGLGTFLDHAFSEIVKAAADHPRVTARVLELLRGMAATSADPSIRRTLQQAGRRLYAVSGTSRMQTADRHLLADRLRSLEGSPGQRDVRPLVH